MDWSCYYEFSDLPIEVNGTNVGVFWGEAELALDHDRNEMYIGEITVYSNSWDGKNLVVPRDHWLYKYIENALLADDDVEITFWEEYNND